MRRQLQLCGEGGVRVDLETYGVVTRKIRFYECGSYTSKWVQYSFLITIGIGTDYVLNEVL